MNIGEKIKKVVIRKLPVKPGEYIPIQKPVSIPVEQPQKVTVPAKREG